MLITVLVSGSLLASLFLLFRYLSYRMDISLDKTVVVTGSSSGIGKSLCQLLLAQGTKVIGVDIKETQIYHPNFKFIQLDLANITREQVEQAFSFEDNIYAIVNCAAISLVNNNRSMTSIIEEPISKINIMFQTNVLGPITLTQALYPLLNSDAMILNVASPTGVLVPPYMGYYGITKATIIAWNDALRREVPFKVCCVMPGFTKTGMNFKAPITSNYLEPEIARCQEKLNGYLDQAQEASDVALTIIYNLFSSNYGYHVYSDVWYMKLGWTLLDVIQTLAPSASDYLLECILQ